MIESKEAVRKKALSGGVFLFVILITVLIISFREQVQHLATYGYAGVFLVSLLGNATVILPAPSLALVFALGSA
ncbi:MAG TPA: hypothetical protein ENG33_05175, partial [Chloroflexi bacterium]|nr:hypothetical protein [Chloroflexota bacterium]